MIHVDFLPERVRLQRRARKNMVRQGVLVAITIVLMSVLAKARHGQIASAQAELLLLDERTAVVAVQAEQRAELEQQMNELLMKKNIDEQLGSRVNALDILGELQRLMGDGLVLTRFELLAMEVEESSPVSMEGGPMAAPEEPTMVRRVRLVLTGVAPSDIAVANFIGQLASSPLFEDISMSYSRNTEMFECNAREFQVMMFVVR